MFHKCLLAIGTHMFCPAIAAVQILLMVDDSSRVVASGLLPSLPTANVFLEGGKLHDVTHFEQIAYLLRCLSRHVSCVSVSLGLWVRFRTQLALGAIPNAALGAIPNALEDKRQNRWYLKTSCYG